MLFVLTKVVWKDAVVFFITPQTSKMVSRVYL